MDNNFGQFGYPRNNVPMQGTKSFSANGNNQYKAPINPMGYDSVSFAQQQNKKTTFWDKTCQFFSNHWKSICTVTAGIGALIAGGIAWNRTDVDYSADKCPENAKTWIAKGKFYICNFLNKTLKIIPDYKGKSTDETSEGLDDEVDSRVSDILKYKDSISDEDIKEAIDQCKNIQNPEIKANSLGYIAQQAVVNECSLKPERLKALMGQYKALDECSKECKSFCLNNIADAAAQVGSDLDSSIIKDLMDGYNSLDDNDSLCLKNIAYAAAKVGEKLQPSIIEGLMGEYKKLGNDDKNKSLCLNNIAVAAAAVGEKLQPSIINDLRNECKSLKEEDKYKVNCLAYITLADAQVGSDLDPSIINNIMERYNQSSNKDDSLLGIAMLADKAYGKFTSEQIKQIIDDSKTFLSSEENLIETSKKELENCIRNLEAKLKNDHSIPDNKNDSADELNDEDMEFDKPVLDRGGKGSEEIDEDDEDDPSVEDDHSVKNDPVSNEPSATRLTEDEVEKVQDLVKYRFYYVCNFSKEGDGLLHSCNGCCSDLYGSIIRSDSEVAIDKIEPLIQCAVSKVKQRYESLFGEDKDREPKMLNEIKEYFVCNLLYDSLVSCNNIGQLQTLLDIFEKHFESNQEIDQNHNESNTLNQDTQLLKLRILDKYRIKNNNQLPSGLQGKYDNVVETLFSEITNFDDLSTLLQKFRWNFKTFFSICNGLSDEKKGTMEQKISGIFNQYSDSVNKMISIDDFTKRNIFYSDASLRNLNTYSLGYNTIKDCKHKSSMKFFDLAYKNNSSSIKLDYWQYALQDLDLDKIDENSVPPMDIIIDQITKVFFGKNHECKAKDSDTRSKLIDIFIKYISLNQDNIKNLDDKHKKFVVEHINYKQINKLLENNNLLEQPELQTFLNEIIKFDLKTLCADIDVVRKNTSENDFKFRKAREDGVNKALNLGKLADYIKVFDDDNLGYLEQILKENEIRLCSSSNDYLEDLQERLKRKLALMLQNSIEKTEEGKTEEGKTEELNKQVKILYLLSCSKNSTISFKNGQWCLNTDYYESEEGTGSHQHVTFNLTLDNNPDPAKSEKMEIIKKEDGYCLSTGNNTYNIKNIVMTTTSTPLSSEENVDVQKQISNIKETLSTLEDRLSEFQSEKIEEDVGVVILAYNQLKELLGNNDKLKEDTTFNTQMNTIKTLVGILLLSIDRTGNCDEKYYPCIKDLLGILDEKDLAITFNSPCPEGVKPEKLLLYNVVRNLKDRIDKKNKTKSNEQGENISKLMGDKMEEFNKKIGEVISSAAQSIEKTGNCSNTDVLTNILSYISLVNNNEELCKYVDDLYTIVNMQSGGDSIIEKIKLCIYQKMHVIQDQYAVEQIKNGLKDAIQKTPSDITEIKQYKNYVNILDFTCMYDSDLLTTEMKNWKKRLEEYKTILSKDWLEAEEQELLDAVNGKIKQLNKLLKLEEKREGKTTSIIESELSKLTLADLETLDSCVKQTTKYYYKQSWDAIRNNFYNNKTRFDALKGEIKGIQDITEARCLFLTKYIENLDDEHILELSESECAEIINGKKPEKVKQDTWNKFQQVFNNRTENVKRYAPTWIIEKIRLNSNISDKCFPWIKVLDINDIDASNIDEVIKRLWHVYRMLQDGEVKKCASDKLQAIFNKLGVKLSILSETISAAKYICENCGNVDDDSKKALKDKIDKIVINKDDSNDVIGFGCVRAMNRLLNALHKIFEANENDQDLRDLVKNKAGEILVILASVKWKSFDSLLAEKVIPQYENKFKIKLERNSENQYTIVEG